MAEDYYTRQLFRQAQAFERLEPAFLIGRPTEKDLAMAQVCKGMAEVCMMLAEMHIKEKDLAMAQVCKGMAEVCMMLAEMHIKEKERMEAGT